MDRIERNMRAAAKQICRKRGIEYLEERTSDILPIDMSENVQVGLERAAKRAQVGSRKMISGAGHDAMSFAGLCDTGMIFILCAKGISHNRTKFASIVHICDGARVIYEYLKERKNEEAAQISSVPFPGSIVYTGGRRDRLRGS